MRRTTVVVALLLALATMAGVAQASTRSKNRIDHYRYTPCATCPRVKASYVTYDGKGVIHAQKKVTASAYNAGGSNLFSVFGKAESWFAHGHFTRPVKWSADVTYNDGA